VEEGIASGISSFNIIINEDKQAIKNYFSTDQHLNKYLQKINKKYLLSDINNIIESYQFNYIPQLTPLGLGHAILMAKKAIENEFFGIFLPDEIMFGTTPALEQLISMAKKYNASIVAVQEVPVHSVSSYGIVAIKQQIETDLFEIDSLVEKPTVESAPSNLAIIGRYVLSPRIFNALETVIPGANNEIQLTDGITTMMHQGEHVLAYKINTNRHDIGNPMGFLQANIYYGLSDPQYAHLIKHYIQTIMPNN